MGALFFCFFFTKNLLTFIFPGSIILLNNLRVKIFDAQINRETDYFM